MSCWLFPAVGNVSLMCVSFDLDSALFSQASLIPVLSPSRSLCFQSKTVRVFFFNLMVYVRPLHFTSLWCPPAQMHVGYMFIVIDPARMLTAVTLLLTSSTLPDTHSYPGGIRQRVQRELMSTHCTSPPAQMLCGHCAISALVSLQLISLRCSKISNDSRGKGSHSALGTVPRLSRRSEVRRHLFKAG